MSVDLAGPHTALDVFVDGCRIPRLEAHEEGDGILLVLDRRFGLHVRDEDREPVVSFIARSLGSLATKMDGALPLPEEERPID